VRKVMLIIAGVIMIALYGSILVNFSNDFSIIKAENAQLRKQLQTLQQEKQGFKEGKYTMITNLSSSMYLNRIPANFERINPWTDVNGVSGFDVTINGTHYRYVEGHIEMPQLSLYAPNLHLEVVSEKEWPR
jgi:hypothetical protein